MRHVLFAKSLSKIKEEAKADDSASETVPSDPSSSPPSPSGLPPKPVPHCIHVSPSQLDQLKRKVSASLSGDDDVRWISTLDAVNALFWVVSTRSYQRSGVELPPRQSYVFAKNIGKKVGLPRTYFGNRVVMLRADLSVEELLGEGGLLKAAVAIRKTITEADQDGGVERSIEWLNRNYHQGARIIGLEFFMSRGFMSSSW